MDDAGPNHEPAPHQSDGDETWSKSAETSAGKLTAAFHAVYDVKDGLIHGGTGFYEAYEAIQKISTLMDTPRIDVPRRYDAPQQSDGGET